jgi:S-adenosylmethionine:tRNA ribosyltransferase-isomerase
MKLSKFGFELPQNLISQGLNKDRHDCRLMVADSKTGKIEHKKFVDLLEIFNDKDVFVLNNTKVFPARMYGNKEKTGAQIEVFLLRELNKENRLWDVLVDPARKIRVGNKLYFGEDELVAEVVDNTTSRGRTIRFLFDGSEEEFTKVVDKIGQTPIPKYLERELKEEDNEWYQTIFAKEVGAVMPPAVGLHFSREFMMRLDIKGINFTEVTLHQSLGTTKDVEVEDLTKHKMDSEYYFIPQDTSTLVNDAKENKRKILAVGSGALRALESSVSSIGTLNMGEGWTDKFIFPPHDFKIPNCFLTNFHAPKSTLMMATAAFAGYDFAMEIYETAIKEKYKFRTYGDALLVL